jgi:hypothetical protein
MWKKLKSTLAKYNELLSIPVGILLFWLFPKFFVNTAEQGGVATFDAGIWHVLITATAWLFVMTGIIRLYIWLSFPKAAEALDDLFLRGETEAWERKLYSSLFFFGLLLAFILVLKIVAGS